MKIKRWNNACSCSGSGFRGTQEVAVTRSILCWHRNAGPVAFPSTALPGLWKFTIKIHSETVLRHESQPGHRVFVQTLNIGLASDAVHKSNSSIIWYFFCSTDQDLDSVLPFPCLPLSKLKTNETTRNYIRNLFLKMKFYLPTPARKSSVTTFLGRTVLKRCFARKVPTLPWACRQGPASTGGPSAVVFPSRAPILPGRSRTETQLCAQDFTHFSRFDARPVIIVLENVSMW